MKIGLLVDITENFEAKIRHAKSLGFDFGQLAIWDMDFYTEENLAALKKLLAELDFTVTDLWCGWSEPVVWKYPERYTTLGLVPAAWRERRTFDLLKGAEFARKLGVRDIITHIGYLPDNPSDPDNIGVMEAVRFIAQKIKPHGQRLLFETGEELPTTIMILMEQTGCKNLGINFDPSNLLTNGRSEPVLALKRFLPVLGGFHAKDGIAAVGAEPKGKQKEISDLLSTMIQRTKNDTLSEYLFAKSAFSGPKRTECAVCISRGKEDCGFPYTTTYPYRRKTK